MIKVKYSEIVRESDRKLGKLVERSKSCGSITEAVNFSRYIANTANIAGKPVIEETDR